MNTIDTAAPMYGSMTDIHVWDTMLSEEESENWMKCSIHLEGNVFSWQNSSQHVQPKGLMGVNESLGRICDQDRIMFVGRESLNFEETFRHCNKIGSMAVISSYESAIEVKKILKSYGITSDIYTGLTDLEVEGEWVVHDSNQNMTWNNWKNGEPNSWNGNEDCVEMSMSTLKFRDEPCLNLLVPVCNIAEVLLKLVWKIILTYVNMYEPFFRNFN